MSNQVFINDHDLEADLGATAVLAELDGWLAGLESNRSVVYAPDSVNGFVSASEGTQPRAVRIALLIKPATVVARDAAVALVGDLFRGLVEMRTGDSLTKVLDLKVDSREGFPVVESGSFIIPDVFIRWELSAPNPTKRDRFVRCVNFDATRTAVPLGTARSQGIIQIMNATNPVITYRDAVGNSVQTMTFTVTLASDEYLEIDLLNKTIKKYDNGVVTDAITTWTSSTPTAGWIEPDPEHGSYELSQWPTLEISSGEAILIYHRRWEH